MQNQIMVAFTLAFFSAFFAAVTTILAKVGVTGVDANVATAIRTTIVLVLAWGIVIAEANLPQAIQIPPKTLMFLIGSGIATGLSWIFYFRALQLGNTAFVVSIDKSSLVIVVLFAALFLGEPLTLKIILGVLLILSGVLVVIL